MKTQKQQLGFSAVEAVVIVLVLSVIGFVAVSVLPSSPNRNNPPASVTSSTDVASAPQINSADDLDKALKVLDKNDPGGGNSDDLRSLDQELATF